MLLQWDGSGDGVIDRAEFELTLGQHKLDVFNIQNQVSFHLKPNKTNHVFVKQPEEDGDEETSPIVFLDSLQSWMSDQGIQGTP